MSKFTSFLSKTFALGSGYAGAEQSRKRVVQGWRRSTPKDEDKHLSSYSRDVIRCELKDLYRNNSIVKAIIQRVTDNVIGNGIYIQAKTKDQKWNALAEQFFTNWSKSSDFNGRVNLHNQARMGVTARFLDGDCGFILTKGGKVQGIESERIVSPDSKDVYEPSTQIVQGVQLDKYGVTEGYYIGNRTANGEVDNKNTVFVDAADFIFLSNPFRFDQIRGIPDLAPVVNRIRDHDELSEATLTKAKLAAFRAFAVKRKEGRANIPTNGNNRLANVDADYSEVPPLNKIGQMSVYHLTPEESVEDLESKTPSSTYKDFDEIILREISAAIGLPYELMMMNFSTGGYASNRAALLQSYVVFDQWQEWIIENFYRRIWNWRIAKAIKDGTLPPAPVGDDGVSEWYKIDFTTPSRAVVDPGKEISANERAYLLGQTSLTQIVREQGRSIDDVLKEKANDIVLAIKLAAEVNKSVGKEVITFRDIITPSTPGVISNQVLPSDMNQAA